MRQERKMVMYELQQLFRQRVSLLLQSGLINSRAYAAILDAFDESVVDQLARQRQELVRAGVIAA